MLSRASSCLCRQVCRSSRTQVTTNLVSHEQESIAESGVLARGHVPLFALFGDFFLFEGRVWRHPAFRHAVGEFLFARFCFASSFWGVPICRVSERTKADTKEGREDTPTEAKSSPTAPSQSTVQVLSIYVSTPGAALPGLTATTVTGIEIHDPRDGPRFRRMGSSSRCKTATGCWDWTFWCRVSPSLTSPSKGSCFRNGISCGLKKSAQPPSCNEITALPRGSVSVGLGLVVSNSVTSFTAFRV